MFVRTRLNESFTNLHISIFNALANIIESRVAMAQCMHSRMRKRKVYSVRRFNHTMP